MLTSRICWLLIALTALGMCGCDGHAPSADFPSGAMVLRLAARDDIPTLDPAAGYDTASWGFEQMIFDTLVRYSDAGIDLVPDIAISWKMSSDARTFAFELRRDARFSNGRVVVSGDFKYAIGRVLNPATRSQGIEYYRWIVGAEDFIAGRVKSVPGIDARTPYRIIFHLTRPDPIFAHKLAMPFAAAVPREVADRWGEDFSRHVVGSGPFKFKQWIGGRQIVLARNPYYFVKGLPRLDGIVEQIGVDEELQWLKFEAGEIDESSIPPAEFPYVMKTARLKALTLRIVALATHYMGMNCQMRPFTDPRVRRAFNYAVDKRKLIAILNGRGVVASGILPPGLDGADVGVVGYPHDGARARRLLEEAGVRDLSPTLWIRADQTEMILGQSIQQDLATVGVHLEIKPVAWPPLLEAVRQPQNVALFLFGWEADFPDPANFLEVLLSRKQWGANNDAFYYDPQVERLLAEAAPIGNSKKRYGLYYEVEKMAVRDAPWVFLYHPVSYVIRQPWVHGLMLNPMRPTRFDKVWLSPRPPK
jgi:peptide/nickel transport system substrate-binding protein